MIMRHGELIESIIDKIKTVDGLQAIVLGGLDFLYRDTDFVSSVIDACNKGEIQSDYWQQPAYGFHSYMYCAETNICKILPDSITGYFAVCRWAFMPVHIAERGVDTGGRIFKSNRIAKKTIQAMPILSEIRSNRPARPSCALAIAKATKKATIRMPVRTE